MGFLHNVDYVWFDSVAQSEDSGQFNSKQLNSPELWPRKTYWIAVTINTHAENSGQGTAASCSIKSVTLADNTVEPVGQPWWTGTDIIGCTFEINVSRCAGVAVCQIFGMSILPESPPAFR
jgi:hypothetical protein